MCTCDACVMYMYITYTDTCIDMSTTDMMVQALIGACVRIPIKAYSILRSASIVVLIATRKVTTKACLQSGIWGIPRGTPITIYMVWWFLCYVMCILYIHMTGRHLLGKDLRGTSDE